MEAPTSGWLMSHMLPSVEAVREIKVQPSTLSAQYRRSGNVEIATKSGGNQFHGSLFEYHNNGAFNAKPYFATGRTSATSNAFGGSLGGPIRRGKTFFHGVYEVQIDRSPFPIAPNVATARMQQGDFSRVRDSRGNLLVIRDPLTGQPFEGNIIPSGRFSPVSLAYQKRFFPTPNFGDPDSVATNWRSVEPLPVSNQEVLGRLDHRFSNSNWFYFWGRTKRTGKGQLVSSLPTAGPHAQVRWPTALSASDTHVFRQNLINEFRFGFYRERNRYGPKERYGTSLVEELGIQGLLNVPEEANAVSRFLITGFNTVGSFGDGDQHYKTQQYTDTLSWISGRHSLKFGADVRRIAISGYAVNDDVFGSFNFDGFFTGNAYADFLLGLPHISGRRSPPIKAWGHNTDAGFFAQDDFKVSPRLTLNFGLRYELQSVPYTDGMLMANFDPVSGKLVVPNSEVLSRIHPSFPVNLAPVVMADAVGFPERLRHMDRNNIAPRIGFAYRPLGRTTFVVRGGYGIFTDVLPQDIGLGRGGLFETFESFTNQIVNGRPLFQFPNPFASQPGAAGAQSVAGTDPRFVNPYVQQWNFALDRDFRGTAVRLAYVGTQSVGLGYRRNINRPPASMILFAQARRPNPLYRDIIYADNGATQTYHALQLEAERAFARGFMLQTSYTWLKSLTDADDATSPLGPEIMDPYNRVREKGNNRDLPNHRFTLNGLYEMPFGRGKRWLTSGPTSQILGGWQVSWMAVAQTAGWFSPAFSGIDPSNTDFFGGLPDRIGNGNLPSDQRSVTRWFDASAFVFPPTGVGRFGNSGRNILHGPPSTTVSLGVFKTVNLSEVWRLRFEATATNLANHPNFGYPANNISAPGSVARISGTWSQDNATSRNVRLGMRLDF